jgi:hypothetical protein
MYFGVMPSFKIQYKILANPNATDPIMLIHGLMPKQSRRI